MCKSLLMRTTVPRASLLVESANCGKASTGLIQIHCATSSTNYSRASSKNKPNSRHPRLSNGMRTLEQPQASRRLTPRRCPAS
nr:MAG TPA: hypothetical protein [Caudoviricetes sp.]